MNNATIPIRALRAKILSSMLHLPYTPNEKADQRKGSDTGLVGVTDSASAWEAGMGPKWIDLYENLQL